MEKSNYPHPIESELSDQLISEIQLAPATTGQRFLNYLIDNLLLQYGLSILSGMVVGMLLGLLFPDYMLRLSQSTDTFAFLPFAYLIVIVNYLVYYTICEKAFKGYTLGKLITGTRAIRDDGNELTFKDALLRSLSRLVPFEVFSAFGGYPWHDSWTRTRVIKSR
ncbi:MAG TPA: RDD family protein [Chitinophagaceae bacterium]|nr:RDD family protein [Chitinophagaceae bacterium]